MDSKVSYGQMIINTGKILAPYDNNIVYEMMYLEFLIFDPHPMKEHMDHCIIKWKIVKSNIEYSAK